MEACTAADTRRGGMGREREAILQQSLCAPVQPLTVLPAGLWQVAATKARVPCRRPASTQRGLQMGSIMTAVGCLHERHGVLWSGSLHSKTGGGGAGGGGGERLHRACVRLCSQWQCCWLGWQVAAPTGHAAGLQAQNFCMKVALIQRSCRDSCQFSAALTAVVAHAGTFEGRAFKQYVCAWWQQQHQVLEDKTPMQSN